MLGSARSDRIRPHTEPTHCGAPKQPSSTAGPRTCALSSCSSGIPGSKVRCGISELRLMTHWRLPSRPKHSPILRWRRPPDWAAAFLREIARGPKKNWTDILGVSDPDPSLAKIGSGHSPRMLKTEKQPFVMRELHLFVPGASGSECIAATGPGWRYFSTRPRPAAGEVEN